MVVASFFYVFPCWFRPDAAGFSNRPQYQVAVWSVKVQCIGCRTPLQSTAKNADGAVGLRARHPSWILGRILPTRRTFRSNAFLLSNRWKTKCGGVQDCSHSVLTTRRQELLSRNNWRIRTLCSSCVDVDISLRNLFLSLKIVERHLPPPSHVWR